jgi:hypothetical protein
MVRLCRFYEQLGVDKQTELCQTVYKIVTGRPDHLCSFVDDEKTFGPDTKLVYRHFATLYFCILSDRSESELAMLDLIQVYVETLDRVFENVVGRCTLKNSLLARSLNATGFIQPLNIINPVFQNVPFKTQPAPLPRVRAGPHLQQPQGVHGAG